MADTDSLLEFVLGRVLSVSQSALTAASVPVPERSAQWHTEPVMDLNEGSAGDDLLGVWCERVEARAAGANRPSSSGEGQSQGWHSVALVRVQYHRCYPNLDGQGSAPSSAEVTEATQKLARAAWALWVALGAAKSDGSLFAGAVGGMSIDRDDVGIGQLTPIKPNGYAAGWQVGLEVGMPLVLVQS